MAEYITREDAQKVVCWVCGVCKNPSLQDLMACEVCNRFAKIPSADVVPLDNCPICIGCDGKAEDGRRTELCEYEEEFRIKCNAQCMKHVKIARDYFNHNLIERKTGTWIDKGYSYDDVPHRVKECSICGYDHGNSKWPYCPICGAKMKGDNKDAD